APARRLRVDPRAARARAGAPGPRPRRDVPDAPRARAARHDRPRGGPGGHGDPLGRVALATGAVVDAPRRDRTRPGSRAPLEVLLRPARPGAGGARPAGGFGRAHRLA